MVDISIVGGVKANKTAGGTTFYVCLNKDGYQNGICKRTIIISSCILANPIFRRAHIWFISGWWFGTFGLFFHISYVYKY
jgi:hypothetical protein